MKTSVFHNVLRVDMKFELPMMIILVLLNQYCSDKGPAFCLPVIMIACHSVPLKVEVVTCDYSGF